MASSSNALFVSRWRLAFGASLALALTGCDYGATTGESLPSSSTTIVAQTVQTAAANGFGAQAFPSPQTQPRAFVLAYANAQHGVDRAPADIDPNWGMKAAPYDAAAGLQQALAQNQLQPWIASLAPPQPAYEALRQTFVRYQTIARAGGWPELPPGTGNLRDTKDPRFAVLRQRLTIENGDAANSTAPFDAAQAIKQAQARYGLPITGKLDEPTRAALNVPAKVRLQQIQANLQRWRWAPRDEAPSRIVVNIAAGLADVYLDNAPAMHMRVAVGRPGDETPMLSSRIHTIVLNPTWTVPDSIAQNELLPKEQAQPGYLARAGFTLKQDGDKPRLVQQPSAQNALGVVKFQFDNKYGVYLHDTPAKAAFAQSQRSVSHGCVRLERAVDLANALLAREPGWDAAKISSVLASGATTDVKLAAPIAVELYYWTAWVQDGQIQFRRDIYGWDNATAQLANGVVTKPVAQASGTPPPSAEGRQALAALDDMLPSETAAKATYQDYYTSGDDVPDPFAEPAADRPAPDTPPAEQ